MHRPDPSQRPDRRRSRSGSQAMAGLIAHAFAGPVLTLRSAAEEAAGRHPGDPDLAGVVAAAGRLEVLLDGLTRLQAVERQPFAEPVDLDAALRTALRRVRLHGYEPDVRAAPLGTVLADESHVVTMLVELLTNVALHCGACPQVLVHAVRRGPQLELLLADAGPGLPPAIDRAAPRLFSRVGGGNRTAGCGLAICGSLAEVNGGALHLDDGPSGGTLVRLVLPAGDR